jgi:hypothetical protein
LQLKSAVHKFHVASCNYLHGAGPFLRSRQLHKHSRNSQHFIETQRSITVFTTALYLPLSWVNQSSPYHPMLRSILTLSSQNPVFIPPRPHGCYIPCPSHPPRLDESNYTWRRLRFMTLLITQFSPTSYCWISNVKQ